MLNRTLEPANQCCWVRSGGDTETPAKLFPFQTISRTSGGIRAATEVVQRQQLPSPCSVPPRVFPGINSFTPSETLRATDHVSLPPRRLVRHRPPIPTIPASFFFPVYRLKNLLAINEDLIYQWPSELASTPIKGWRATTTNWCYGCRVDCSAT